MNYGQDQNPYAPPTQFDQRPPPGFGNDELEFPAERGDRFLARLCDGLLSLACMLPWAIVVFWMEWLTFGDLKQNRFASLILSPAALPLAIYQWVLVSNTGQTLGKRWLRIKVVKMDGSPVGFGNGVALREWVPQAISFIPCVGGLISLVGYLLIFGEDRRCLHDVIAGTKVIKTLS